MPRGATLRFGPFEFDPAGAELRKAGRRVEVQEMPLRVLAMLLERPGEVVMREQIFTRLWPDDLYGILDDHLNTAIRKLRLALGDSARRPRYIETVPRRGYRFTAPVEPAQAASPPAAAPSGESGHERHSMGCSLRGLSQLFVGREREMEELRAALDTCLGGRDQLVLVAGEAGIGKTRIAERLAEEASLRGLTVLWGRSLEERAGPPYWPWVQILRALIGVSDAERVREEMGPGAADIATIVPELARQLGVQPAEALDYAEENRFRLFDSIARYLQHVSRRTPLVLVLDNLHWAGPPSLLLLAFLAQNLTDSPVLFLGTYRGAEVTRQHPLFDILGVLNRESLFSRLELQGLGRDEVAAFFEAVTGARAPGELTDAIHRHTEGNPFFAAELVRLLITEGVVKPGQATIQAPQGQPLVIAIPQGIRELLGKRLNHLSATCNRVLSEAAVIGREFSPRVLRRLLHDIDDETLHRALEEAENNGVITQDSAGLCFRFSHALIRETLYDELSASRCARIHARIGAIIEQQHHSVREPHLVQLAYHFSKAATAGHGAKALEYNLRAAVKAEWMLAHEEAAGYYQAALEMVELAEADDERQWCTVTLAVARSLSKAGHIGEALDWIGRAAALARRIGHVEGLIEACRILEYITSKVGVSGSGAVQLVEETLSLLSREDSALRVELLSALAVVVVNDGQVQRGQATAAEGIAMARRVGNERALAMALRAWLYARYPGDELDVRLAAAREVIVLAEALRDSQLECDGHDLCSFYLMEKGDIAAADAHRARSRELGEGARRPFDAHKHLVYRAMRAILEGRYLEGERLAVQALERGRRIWRDAAEGIFGVQMFVIRRDQGRLGELSLAVRSISREQPADAVWQPGLALIYVELGMTEEARAALERLVRDDFAAVPRDALWPACLAFLAEVAVELGEQGHAVTIYDQLQPYRARVLFAGASVACLGAGAHYLGLLAHCLGQRRDAVAHFEAAMALNERMGAWPWLARTREAYGRLLLEGGPGNAIRARPPLQRALATACELGMSGLEARIRQRLTASR
ncbi:BREX system ATP-binding domain-containing protein [Aquisalimonas sp.]|uniref:ATP-binding protein n=1 Tax=Aquisalimonas sp. TaxID=1872621 RepID=UPI0025BC6045|nr:BREX system ATP-binding domain-containing protein [Aquisalimonas sp.]